MILTVDIGNSRIKWALWQVKNIVARGVAAYEVEEGVGVYDKLFSPVEKPARVFAVCVAGDDMSRSLTEWVKQRWHLDVRYLKTQKKFNGITNAYQDPAQHGVDRWAAVVAGHQCYPHLPVCVISAGTAITFDLVEKNGRHLGGYILPSYFSMHAALIADTAKVESSCSMQWQKHRVPDNTSDAVNQGLHILLQAGIRELCRLAASKMEGSVQILVTGGFAEVILSYPDMPTMHHCPDLVMQGLYTIMQLDAAPDIGQNTGRGE